MAETLLSPSNVLLYGRAIDDLSIKPGSHEPGPSPRKGHNNFLDKQLQGKDCKLARIYGFSYEGHYYDLAKPALFLVHGDGVDADTRADGSPPQSRALSSEPDRRSWSAGPALR